MLVDLKIKHTNKKIFQQMSANSHSETNVENTPQNIFDIFHGILVVFILLETANNSVICCLCANKTHMQPFQFGEETIVSNGIWQLNCWLQGSALVLLIGNSAFIHKREHKLMKHFGFLLKQERSLNVLEFFSHKMLLILFSKGWQLVIVYIKDIAAV